MISTAHDAGPEVRLCDHPGCVAEGTYRAPRTRALDAYLWLCLDHVRAYNASWDYYRGMTQPEIEQAVRADATWQRPSWPFGAARHGANGWTVRDDFGVFEDAPGDARSQRRSGAPHHGPLGELDAYAVLDLSPRAGAEEIRSRYVALVKELHPDANGGDKAAEERLKLVNDAYSTLKNANVP